MAADSFTLIGVFFVGLGLNLTPCVYPMLSITVSLFGTRKSTNRFQAFAKALIYVLGMATMYSVLGTGAAVTGDLFGAALQNKWVLVGLSVVLTLVALSMFGLYVFQLPSAWIAKLTQKKGAGLIGLYFSGMLVGLIAAPCIGPPVVALLTYVSTKGDPTFAFWTFFVMSLGLGLPYLVLGTFSGLLSKLPKSGVWLIWVERLFGVIMLTVAGFYLSLALYPEGIKWVIPSALIWGGIYLALERSAKYPENFSGFKKAFGALAVIIGLLLPAFMPKEGVVWETFTPQRLEASLEAGKPVVIDFYADWCIPCHELDQFTYSDPQVIKALEGFGRFKVDLTTPDAVEAQELIGRYEIIGVPTVLFLEPSGDEVEGTRLTGFVPADEFLEILDSSELLKITK